MFKESPTIKLEQNLPNDQELERFVINHYPFKKSSHTEDEILDNAFNDMRKIIRKDGKEMQGVLSYNIETDKNEEKYIEIGIILVAEDFRGDGLSEEMWEELKNIAKNEKCSYITATADTIEGKNLLEKFEFYEDDDPITGFSFYRFDLE